MDSVDNYSSSPQVSKELKISQSHLLEIADVSKTISASASHTKEWHILLYNIL